MLRALSSEQHFKSLEHEGKGIGAPPTTPTRVVTAD